jgi:restriction system-associated AAA family ATPase
MKLLSLKIHKADTCGGLLDGLTVKFRDNQSDTGIFNPLCLIGPNGSGKSQLLQLIAEIFQVVFCKYTPEEERGKPNNDLEFELEYLINTENDLNKSKHVRISRHSEGKRKPDLNVDIWQNGIWTRIEDPMAVSSILPSKIIAYTSGENETLSLPFFVSRSGYAKEVRNNARDPGKRGIRISDPRLLLIDYGTNLEVLVANLLLNHENIRKELLQAPNLKSLRSFRCVIQLNHSQAPGKNGVELTNELTNYIEYMKRCSTCYLYNEKTNSYILDFFVNDATHNAFWKYWDKGAINLYSSFHKLAMLNDLMVRPQNLWVKKGLRLSEPRPA